MFAIKEYTSIVLEEVAEWIDLGAISGFPENDGVCILHDGFQIAIFHFTRRNEWYATQNLCPHKNQMILSRGLIGSAANEPKVSCPYHKNSFSMKNGRHMNGDLCQLATYPVKETNGRVYLGWKSR